MVATLKQSCSTGVPEKAVSLAVVPRVQLLSFGQGLVESYADPSPFTPQAVNPLMSCEGSLAARVGKTIRIEPHEFIAV